MTALQKLFHLLVCRNRFWMFRRDGAKWFLECSRCLKKTEGINAKPLYD